MADEIANDVSAEISLDDFNADEQPPAKADPSPAAKDAPAAADKAEAKGADQEQTDDTAAPPEVPLKTETEDPEKVEETETDNKPTKADDRKSQLNTEIRDLVSQRNALRAEVEKANAEVYQPATEDELTEQGYNAIEAKVEAMRQEREMEKYNSSVAEAQLTIGHESQRVLTDFPLFDPESAQYDQELASAAAEHVASMLVIDPNSQQVIGANGSIYNYYKTLDRASGISAARGEIKGQANTEKQLANVDAASNAAPAKAKTDPLMELWKSAD
jgi:hypothetical protein